MGFITTKVKADGRFFLASVDLGSDGTEFKDAHSPLEQDKRYWGNVLEGSDVGSTQYIEYTKAESAEFKGDQLEELPGDFRLVPFR